MVRERWGFYVIFPLDIAGSGFCATSALTLMVLGGAENFLLGKERGFSGFGRCVIWAVLLLLAGPKVQFAISVIRQQGSGARVSFGCRLGRG
jgi:hypothetical protein